MPNVKLVWSPRALATADWRLGLFGQYRRGDGGPWSTAISGRGILLWGLGLATAGYLGGAAALWVILEQKPHNSITYTELISHLPRPSGWHWLQARRGADMVLEGLDDLQKHSWSNALLKLDIGLKLNPTMTQGRIELASFQLQTSGRQQAEQTLLTGLEAGYPGRDYLTKLIAVAAQGENFSLWLKACDTALAQLAAKPALAGALAEDRLWLVRQKLGALLAAKRNDEAVRIAEAEGETNGPIMREFKTLALFASGPPTAAVEFLATWRAQVVSPAELTKVRRLQARAYREAGRPEEMGRVLDELRDAAPADPTPYVYAIIQRLLAGQHDAAKQSYNQFFFRFGAKPSSLTMLAEPLAEIGEEPLLQRLIEQARAQRLDLMPLHRALVAAQLHNSHWTDAAATIEAMRPGIAKSDPIGKFWIEWTSRIVTAAGSPASDAQAAIVTFIRSNFRRLPLPFFRDTLTALRHAGRPETAQRVFEVARGAYPDSVTLREQTEAIAHEVALAQAAAQPEAKPAAPPLPPEPIFFQTLTAALEAADFAAARTQLAAARDASPVPAWLAARDAELRRAEVLVAARLHDSPSLTAAITLWLNGSAERAREAVELAQQLRASTAPAEAERLLDGVLKRTPNYAPAIRLLAEWRPPVVSSLPATPAGLVPTVIASETRFMQALTAATADNPAMALSHLRAARAANPAWLAARDAELRRAEIQLDARMGENAAMISAARLYLNGDRARSQAALDLAQTLHDSGRPEAAVLLVQEVLRKAPSFAPANRLLADWEAATAKP